jgi:tetratricopeptide (TPR) repeat protein
MTDDRRGNRGRPADRRGAPSASGRGAGGSSGAGRSSGASRRASGSGGRRQSGRGSGAAEERGGFGPYGAPDENAGRRPRRERADERPQERTRSRPALRTVGERRAPKETSGTRARRSGAAPAKRRRRRSGPADVEVEVRRLAGRNGDRFLRLLMDAADAFANDREREALRILRPVREQLPDSPTVRELAGLCQYRIGNYGAAARELEAYAELTGAVDQNPVLMDCYRAQRRWRKVDEKWRELAAASPSAEAVAEGRIVQAGALADQGRLDEALGILRRRSDSVRNPREHHLRLWYALGDLEERAGNHAAARDLFDRVRRADPGYADVAERRAALN